MISAKFLSRSLCNFVSRTMAIGLVMAITSLIQGHAVQAGETLNLSAATDESTRDLSGYLKIDTSNPPGNERSGAEYLSSLLAAAGIKSEIFETAPNRACIYARLKGSGKKRAIILLNHIDVVPAAASDWRHPPFEGAVHDGELWGRGAIDMKGMAIAELEAMVLLKRSGCPIDRDIIFLGTPDEEVGATYGASWFVKHHADLVGDAEFLINEGFHIDTDSTGKALYWGVDIAEKSALWLKLTAHGQAGHASMPIADSANNSLVRALNKIVNSPPDVVLLPAVEDYYHKIANAESQPTCNRYKNIQQSVKDPATLKLLQGDRLKYSMLQNTVSLTILKSGYKTNVIPAESTAELDCRLLPGVDHERFMAKLKNAIADPKIDISILDWQSSPASSYDTELFRDIEKVAAEDGSPVPVVPVIVPWFTDSHWFRSLGITAYGFEPFKIDALHLATMHGNDERIPVKEIGEGSRRLYRVLQELACSRP